MKTLEQQAQDKQTAINQAIKNDQFTLAAQLRDELNELKEELKTVQVRKYAL
jgi:protein-arginine kinase activator protein McsA